MVAWRLMSRIAVCLTVIAMLATGCRERNRKLSVATAPHLAARRATAQR